MFITLSLWLHCELCFTYTLLLKETILVVSQILSLERFVKSSVLETVSKYCTVVLKIQSPISKPGNFENQSLQLSNHKFLNMLNSFYFPCWTTQCSVSLESVLNCIQSHKDIQSNDEYDLKTKHFSSKLFFHNGLPNNAAVRQDFKTLFFNYIGKQG